jgi:hypothetical protein
VSEATGCKITLPMGKVVVMLSVPFKKREVASVRRQLLEAVGKAYDAEVLRAQELYNEGKHDAE